MEVNVLASVPDVSEVPIEEATDWWALVGQFSQWGVNYFDSLGEIAGLSGQFDDRPDAQDVKRKGEREYEHEVSVPAAPGAAGASSGLASIKGLGVHQRNLTGLGTWGERNSERTTNHTKENTDEHGFFNAERGRRGAALGKEPTADRGRRNLPDTVSTAFPANNQPSQR